jgi:hypothetical protein
MNATLTPWRWFNWTETYVEDIEQYLIIYSICWFFKIVNSYELFVAAYHTTRRRIPEGRHRNIRRWDSLTSRILFSRAKR